MLMLCKTQGFTSLHSNINLLTETPTTVAIGTVSCINKKYENTVYSPDENEINYYCFLISLGMYT